MSGLGPDELEAYRKAEAERRQIRVELRDTEGGRMFRVRASVIVDVNGDTVIEPEVVVQLLLPAKVLRLLQETNGG